MAKELYSYQRYGNYSWLSDPTPGAADGLGQGCDWNKLAAYQNPALDSLENGGSIYISDLLTEVSGVPVRFLDGTVSAPGASWGTEITSGLYKIGTNRFGFSIGGTLEVEFNSSGLAIADMTLGSVLFAGASGQVTQDNANFFWNDSSNRLGIGTSSPSAKIHSLSTTEQLRLGYDTSAYGAFTVDSAGVITIDSNGGTFTSTGTYIPDFLGVGASPLGTVAMARIAGARTVPTGSQEYYGLKIHNTFAEASSGFHSVLAQCGLFGAAITDSGIQTYLAATLYVNQAPSGADDNYLMYGVTFDTSTRPLLHLQQTGTGDCAIRNEDPNTSYIYGIDRSDSSKWKLSYAAAFAVLGTNDRLTVDTSGEVTVTQWFQVGTATDAAAQGDAVFGLTGNAYRLFWDQSDGDLRLFRASTGAACMAIGPDAGDNDYWGIGVAAGISTITASNYIIECSVNASDPGLYINAPFSGGYVSFFSNNSVGLLDLRSTGAEFNSGGAALDFKVRSDSLEYQLFVNGSTNIIYFGGSGSQSSAHSYYRQSDALWYYYTASNDSDGNRIRYVKSRAGGACSALDIIATYQFYAFNSTPAETLWADWVTYADTVTAGSEDGRMALRTMKGGALTEFITFGASIGTVINEGGVDTDFRVESDDESYCLMVEGTLNNIVLCANAEPGFNSMDGGVYLANANVVPTGNPSGGGYLYAEGGALKWRGSSGTVTTIAAA